jgi:hypothetical protein
MQTGEGCHSDRPRAKVNGFKDQQSRGISAMGKIGYPLDRYIYRPNDRPIFGLHQSKNWTNKSIHRFKRQTESVQAIDRRTPRSAGVEELH